MDTDRIFCDTRGASADDPANFTLSKEIFAFSELVKIDMQYRNSAEIGDEVLIVGRALLPKDTVRQDRKGQGQAETLQKNALQGILQRNVRLVGELTATKVTIVDTPLRQEIALVEGYPSNWIWRLRIVDSGSADMVLRVRMVLFFGEEKSEVEIGYLDAKMLLTERRWQAVRRWAAEVQPVYAFVATFIAGLGGLIAWLGIKLTRRKRSRKSR